MGCIFLSTWLFGIVTQRKCWRSICWFELKKKQKFFFRVCCQINITRKRLTKAILLASDWRVDHCWIRVLCDPSVCFPDPRCLLATMWRRMKNRKQVYRRKLWNKSWTNAFLVWNHKGAGYDLFIFTYETRYFFFFITRVSIMYWCDIPTLNSGWHFYLLWNNTAIHHEVWQRILLIRWKFDIFSRYSA